MTVNRRLVTVVGRSVGLYEQCVGGTLSSEGIHYVALSRCLPSPIKFSDALSRCIAFDPRRCRNFAGEFISRVRSSIEKGSIKKQAIVP